MTSVLTTTNLTVGYSQTKRKVAHVATDLNLQLRAGECVCLLGPNGAGKSTLLRTLAGMQPALSGTVLLDNQELSTISIQERARLLSVVLTDRTIPDALSVYSLVSLGRLPYTNWSGHLTEKDKTHVDTAISTVGITELSMRSLMTLSDGERQKAMIARALAQQTSIMILDEPTAFLDWPHRVSVLRLLQTLAKEQKKGIILSTHDLDLALRLADTLWLLKEDGSFTCGVPEDMALSGELQKTFPSDSVQLDAETGDMQPATHTDRVLSLEASGLAHVWTRRALLRAGIALCQPPSLPTLTATLENKTICWTIETETTSQSGIGFASLLPMLDEIPLKHSPKNNT